uniref:Uncharacterized protein n=1 Tax=Ciona savignyi TaxID=51511 RepID=H2ZD04_CIOSA
MNKLLLVAVLLSLLIANENVSGWRRRSTDVTSEDSVENQEFDYNVIKDIADLKDAEEKLDRD